MPKVRDEVQAQVVVIAAGCGALEVMLGIEPAAQEVADRLVGQDVQAGLGIVVCLLRCRGGLLLTLEAALLPAVG